MKYCRNCDKEIADQAVVCVGCGVPVGVGTAFCPNCGSETNSLATVCVKCGVGLSNAVKGSTSVPGAPSGKSKVAAGILGILLGSLGIHNFYLGRTNRAIIQLLLGTVGAFVVVGPLISGVWGIVEGIQILTGSIATDAKGNP